MELLAISMRLSSRLKVKRLNATSVYKLEIKQRSYFKDVRFLVIAKKRENQSILLTPFNKMLVDNCSN